MKFVTPWKPEQRFCDIQGWQQHEFDFSRDWTCMWYLPDSAFNPIDTREVLGLPEGADPVVFTALGYTDNQSGLKKRKSPADIVNYERWQWCPGL